MDELFGRWSSLSLMEAEEEVAAISEELVEKGRRIMPAGLVGKLLSNRIVNKQGLSEIVRRLWGIPKGLDIKFLANNHFVFTFEHVQDIDKVFSAEPWSFNRSLLVL